MEDIKWHCPRCLRTTEGDVEYVAYAAAVHLDAEHEIDVIEMDDEAILALDDRLVHEVADMIADSQGGVSMEEYHRELAKDIRAKFDEVRGEREDH